MLTPASHFYSSELSYLRKTNKNIIFLYFIIVSVFSLFIVCLPFVYTDITISAPGVLRPSSERTEIKSPVNGYVDSVHFTEGAYVNEKFTIVSLKSDELSNKADLLKTQLNDLNLLIHDLQLLTTGRSAGNVVKQKLQTVTFKQQLRLFESKSAQEFLVLKKLQQELNTSKLLATEKVIAGKELFDKQIEVETQQSICKSVYIDQVLKWQEQLNSLEKERVQLESQQAALKINRSINYLISPVTGTLQFVQPLYAGNFIQAGQTVCVVSPRTTLIAECMLTGKDVALVRVGQAVRFKVEAFNYSHFGLINGSVQSIDDDYTLMDKMPVFKVRCRLDDDKMKLKNGFTGHLKKGLTLQAGFIISRRSLWQLLFDRVSDWLNPQTNLRIR